MGLPRKAFKTPPQTPPENGASPEGREKPALDDEDPRSIQCRQCGEDITAPDFRIAIQGAHRHTFANPIGVVFEVGCFSRVRAVRYVGPETDEFTWFNGFSWRIALCGRCQVHLGWRFTATRADDFHALIVDRLRYPGQSDGAG